MENKSMIKEKNTPSVWIIFSVLILYTAFMFLLLGWGFFTTLKTRTNFMNDPVFLPEGGPWEWAWENYATVFDKFALTVNTPQGRTSVNIWGQFLNSLLYAGGGALSGVISCCIMSYLVAKYKCKFSEIVYIFVIIAMIVPIVGSTPSMLLLLRTVNLYDTYIGMWMMKFSFAGLYFLVFHAAFKQIPKDFSEAAKMDGAGELTIFIRFMIPMVMPTFLTIFILNFITLWNDYTFALLYMPSHPTIAYGVYKMSITSIQGLSTPPFRLASCFIMITPILIIFLAFRNKIMGNVTMGGVKE